MDWQSEIEISEADAYKAPNIKRSKKKNHFFFDRFDYKRKSRAEALGQSLGTAFFMLVFRIGEPACEQLALHPSG